MWYAKMYFSEKKEVFQFDSHGVQGVPSTYRELPFLESLLSFLEMDTPSTCATILALRNRGRSS